ncbi:HAD domain-containing protein [Glutamicibacter nicotianae]|uniref:HAD domain-containing protein n=1 Tax=Glutamicibacter nicotianae TaxID=37929 RepID=UPI0019590F43|nr:HAD domain-containing protein [Glutamicibacter nicotianae]MBM7767786.1 hypothetical protein [Glutamicibacter nicotianae]
MATPKHCGHPVVALDVDGVLNADASAAELGAGWIDCRVEIPASDVPDSPFVSGPGRVPLSLELTINPSLHGPWIEWLRESADVVWATTWEEAANKHLAPLLGIEPIPVAVSMRETPPRFGVAISRDAVMWKAMALQRRYNGRPVVWIDDGNRVFARKLGRLFHIVTTNPRLGIAEGQMNEVNEYVRRKEPRR